jgi:hypothetical protein
LFTLTQPSPLKGEGVYVEKRSPLPSRERGVYVEKRSPLPLWERIKVRGKWFL